MLPNSTFYCKRYHHLNDDEYEFKILNERYEYDFSANKQIINSYIDTLAGDKII